jgi:hypothetical protein
MMRGARPVLSFIRLILIVEKPKFAGRQMNPDEQPDSQPEPAGEKPAAPASAEGQRRPDPRRPRFRGGRRGGRGGRGGGSRESRPDDRGESSPPRERESRERESSEPRPAGDLRTAIEQVEEVQADLEKVLEDINEILRTLVQADREKTGSEREIEMLRESLRRLRGDRGGYRQAKTPSSEPAPTQEPTAPESDESEDQEEPDNPA